MKKFVVTAVAAVSALAFAASALASALPANQALQFQGAGSHVWNVKGGDSPHDTNTKALRLHVGDPSTGGYVVAYSKRSIHIATDAEAVKNLSFEFKATGYVGAGSPRISVEFQNGDVAYLSASYCNHTIGSDWSRADFTRFKTDCSIWVAGVQQYEADGRGRRGASTPTPTPIRWSSRRTSSATRPGRLASTGSRSVQGSCTRTATRSGRSARPRRPAKGGFSAATRLRPASLCGGEVGRSGGWASAARKDAT